MNIFKKIKEWFYESNHDDHFWFGGMIFAMSVFLCLLLNTTILQMIIISNFVVLGTMITAEYKDENWGGSFDWQDILAGMLLPIVLTLLSCIIWLLVS